MRRNNPPNPVASLDNLRERIERLFVETEKKSFKSKQLSLDFPSHVFPESDIRSPRSGIVDFLDFLTDALPEGDIYLFGGLLRDIAFFGKRGFNSDVDIVVEGDWGRCAGYLDSLDAKKNKFGGYRLEVAGWPVDIWSAERTWAFEKGFVHYKGISSLTKTTILNWDAILMNWRTRHFICDEDYMDNIRNRCLDVVLEDNPNPIGMAVRVLRHFLLKDARKISGKAAAYLANCVRSYSLDELRASEKASYRKPLIDGRIFDIILKIDSVDRSNRVVWSRDSIDVSVEDFGLRELF